MSVAVGVSRVLVGTAPSAKPLDAVSANAAPDLRGFLWIAGQLAVLVALARLLNIEGGGAFSRLMAITSAAFVVHYWLPLQWKEPFWIAVSLAGSFVLLTPVTALLVLGVGALFFAILASPISYRARVSLVVAVSALLIYGRATSTTLVPFEFWAVLGAVFMFRLMIYVYDLGFAETRPTLREYLAYFFQLPNYYFVLYPVVDFATMRKSYYRRDGRAIAQQGLLWMARGIAQLILYRLIYLLKPAARPDEVTTFATLVIAMVTTYLLYLRVSGQFHLIIGLLHLFGYDLPETHRKYLLARSLTDLWRRINIYWKDFMVKLVYFPVYFRWRKSGEVQAQVVATTCVFVATWALHSYQWFWLRGQVLLSWPDMIFWAILGSLVLFNQLWELRKRARPRADGADSLLLRSVQIGATFSLMTVLWSLWNAASVSEWLDLLTWWRVA